MDGVLIDAREWHYRALSDALDAEGITLTHEQHERELDGLPTKVKLERLREAFSLSPAQVESIARDKQMRTLQIVENSCKPVGHIIEALEELKGNGFKIAVASNSVRRSVDLMLDRSGITPLIEFSLSNSDVRNPKPAPDLYLMAAEKLGVSAKSLWVVEDNPNGVEAARSAGANVIRVNDPSEVNRPNATQWINRWIDHAHSKGTP